jgi:2-dehydro-3-deoxyphosphogluconate aldolase/(4S)-4-hydroxy-2-oxoglutarate aldolase
MSMARFRRMEVLSALYGGGLVPLFYHPDGEVASKTAAAVADGGCRVIEFTNRGDRAVRAFEALAERCEREHPGLILGVGSIVDAPTAALYLSAGACFLVAPNFDPEVARLANRRGVAYIPGCASVGEVLRALEAGVEIVKIFPADSLGGPDFFSAIRGPCPWVSLMPTGGVDLVEENIRGWIRAGAACVGMGSKLLSKDVLARGDWPEVARRVRLVLGWIAAARKG